MNEIWGAIFRRFLLWEEGFLVWWGGGGLLSKFYSIQVFQYVHKNILFQ